MVVRRTTCQERCPHGRRAFTEPDPIRGARRRLTRRVRERLGRECRHQTVQRLAPVHALSPTTVRRWRAEVVAAQQARGAEPLRIRGIDEVS